MSNSRPIEIVSVTGEGFAFGPAALGAAGELIEQPSANGWTGWLQQMFMAKFQEQADRWEAVTALLGSRQRAQSPMMTFAWIAKRLAKDELQVRCLPAPKPTFEASGGDAGPADEKRIQEPQGSPAVSMASGSPAPRGASHDDMGQDVAHLQTRGDPVAPATGEEILTLDDFKVAAPMPLHWQRWYRSRHSERDLGLGNGWFADCLRTIWQGEDATWLLDHEARPVRMPLLAPGEIAWQTLGGQRLERKLDDRMMLTERDGHVWIFVPDGQGSWRPVSVQNALGHRWLFSYDTRKRLLKIDLSPQKKLEFTYGKGRQVSQIQLRHGDHIQTLATYAYDTQSDLVAATTAAGSERYRYRGHLLVDRKLATSYHFLFHWQGQGPEARCIRTHGEDGHHDFRFDYQPEKFQTRVTDGIGNEQVFHYDDHGRITARQDPDGTTHQWHYNGRGQLTAYRLPDGRTNRYAFDSHGRPVLEQLPDGREHRREFNDLGFCIAETLPDGRAVRRQFDPLGRLLREYRTDGSRWQYHYDAQGWLSEACCDTGEVRRTGFDAEGLLCAAEHQGALSRYVFDPQGRLKGHLAQDLVTEYDYQHDHLSAVHQYPEQAPQQRRSRFYEYDQAGRLTGFTTANGEVHGYEYDGLARPSRYRRPDGKAVEYRYDKAQRLTDVIRPDGQKWQLSYNSKGQIIACRAPDGRHIQFQYDAAGDIIHREQVGDWVQHLKRDAGGRVTYQSSQGRDRAPVTKQFQYDSLGRRITANCAGRRLQWRYDLQGSAHEHHQDQHVIRYSYGPGRRLEAIHLPDGTEVNYAYDRLGRWDALAINGKTHLERHFDDQGREQSRQAGANTQTQVWDRHDRLVNRRWQGSETCTRRYSWDAESRLERYSDSKEGARQFQRDPQGQLIADAGQSFHYDDGGNRTTGQTRIQQDRLTETPRAKRCYDALGAETEVRGFQPQRRRFDAEGQLIELTGEGLHVQYGYDALGRRAWRKSAEGTVTYLWHNDALLGELRDGAWQWYLRDPETDAPLILLFEGEAHYYELDWRQAPIRLWAPLGKLAWQGNGDAWGRCQAEGAVHQPIRLPGQFEDELTGLHNNRFRDYDPQTGRYITPDPLGLKGGLNSYRYTPNPIDYIDPLGLNSCQQNAIQAAAAEDGEAGPITEDAPLQNIELAGAERPHHHAAQLPAGRTTGENRGPGWHRV